MKKARMGNWVLFVILVGLAQLGFHAGTLRADTIYLSDTGWSDPGVGTWDAETGTGTLTQDLSDSIYVSGNNITLDGAGHSLTGPGYGSGVMLIGTAGNIYDGVTIKNLTIDGFKYAIFVEFAGNLTVTNNTIRNSITDGIRLESTDGGSIAENTLESNYLGIRLVDSADNSITQNTVSQNQSHGILLTKSVYGPSCHYNVLTDNHVSTSNYGICLSVNATDNELTANSASDNEYGIYLNGAGGNTLTDNTSSNNNQYAIYVAAPSGITSDDNQIYNNNFMHYGAAELAYVDSLCSGNVFHLDMPTGGNFWSYWTSPDEDPPDGIVDDPYVFTGGQDDLPWAMKDGWANQRPVALAGDDQSIIQVDTVVQLDGSQSYDPDGDGITYAWTIIQKPEQSQAILSDPCAPDPNFTADVHGDYVISLTVTDTVGAESDPDSMTVSFENIQPVADPGPNQSVVAGETVLLDGGGSYDANYDLLSYAWTFTSVPDGSGAAFSDPASVQTSFVADLSGEYVVSLVVNDGFVDSHPAELSVTAISTQEAVAMTLVETTETVNNIAPEDFKSKNMAKPLTNKINATLKMIDKGRYSEAFDKLTYDILQKTDGCAEGGEPDKNDWITECTEQDAVYLLVTEAIDYLRDLLESN